MPFACLDAGTQPVPSIYPNGIVNGASYSAAPLAPGSIASIFGNFSVSSPAMAQSLPLPATLAGVSVNLSNGLSAPLFYVSSGQINFQLPWELTGATQASLSVTVNNVTSAAQTISIAPFSPLFSVSTRKVPDRAPS